MADNASLLDLIAHGGSLRSSLDNSQIAADTAHTNAATGLTQAQVPLVNQQTEQEKIKTQLAQRQIRDEEIQRQIWADAGKGMSARGAGLPATDETGSPLPGQGRVGPPAISPAAAPAPGTPLLPGAANAPDFVNYLDNPRAYAMEMARRGASAPAVMGALESGIKVQTNLAKLSKDQLDNEIAGHAVVANSLQGYLNTPDEQKAQTYPQFYADAVAREPNLKAELPPPVAGVAPNQDDLAHVIGKVGLFGTLLSNAKEKQATATSGAQQAEAEATTRKTNTEADLKNLEFQARREFLKNPGQGEASIDGALPPALDTAQNAAFHAEYKAAMGAADDPLGKAAAVVGKAAAYAAQINQANNPKYRAGKAAEAAATARATAPIEIQKAVDTQIAIAKNSPDALAGVADPRARSSAIAGYEKDSKEYADKVTAAEQLRQFVDAAQSGNKAAPGLIPLAEVRQLVNRVNRTELEAAGPGAGSALDKVEGWISGKTEGQPIPPDVLKGIREIGDMQAKSARRNYENKVKITNAATGAKLQPVDLSPSAASQMVRARDPQGVLHEAPAGTPLPAGWKAE